MRIYSNGRESPGGYSYWVDGTVSLPGAAFALDTDSGVYRIGANNLGVAVNGAKVLDVGTGGLGVTGTLTSSSTLTTNISGASNAYVVVHTVTPGTPTTTLLNWTSPSDTNNTKVTVTLNSTVAKALEINGSIAGGAVASLFQVVLDTKVITFPGGLLIGSAASTPTSVATTPGTAATAAITYTGGLGGNTTITTTGTAGVGGGFSYTAGAGGVATAATTAATGGNGGAWAVTTGAGGAEAVAGAGNGTGGNGGAVTYTTGAGGAVTTSTGTNTGGVGGAWSVTTGDGGAASGGTDTGGASGAISLTTGSGGNGDTGGAGGNISLTVGAAGTGSNVAGGTITFSPGAATGTGAVGYITVPNAKAGIRNGGTTAHATTVGTNFLSLISGTAPVGTIATSGTLYSSTTVLRKLIADGTDSAVG